MATRPVKFVQITGIADIVYALDYSGKVWYLDKKTWKVLDRPEEPIPTERSCYWHVANCKCKSCLIDAVPCTG